MHPNCLKGDYNYHLTAFDRAMEAGIDDVGAGVLFGLADPKFEVLGLMMHNEHLEKKYGVGFHTISVPRLRPAEGVSLKTFHTYWMMICSKRLLPSLGWQSHTQV